MVDPEETQTCQTDTNDDNDCRDDIIRDNRRKRTTICILIAVIIILILLFHIFFFFIGRIGVSPDDHTSNTTIFKEYIYTCGGNVDVPNTDAGNTGNTGNTGGHSCPECPECEEGIDIIPAVKVSDDQTEYNQNTEVDIFQNVKYAGEKIIAPGSSGQYVFYVQNVGETNISYDISFSDMMTNPVNMKYKLRVDNIYIRGSKNHYVDLDELTVEDIKVLVGSNNLFFLEWYWADDDPNDTYTGSQVQFETQTYTLNIKVDARSIE